MENQQKLMEIHKLIHEKQARFTYYIIGLCVAATAFSVNKTTDDKLTYSHIFLGIAVICWGVSVFSGLKFMKVSIEALYVNRNALDIIESTHGSVIREEVERQIESYQDKNDPTLNKLFARVLYFFYAGIFFFIVWHVIIMTQN